MSEKMTDEDVTRELAWAPPDVSERLRAHIAALTAERKNLATALTEALKERLALRERVTALEASVTRLRDGLWARGFAAEYPSEAGSVVDCALATVAGAESRLAAIRQRAGDIEAMDDAHSGGGIVGVSRHILGADAPSPSESTCQHCGRTTNGRDAHLCTKAARVAPSEMSGQEGEMVEASDVVQRERDRDGWEESRPPVPTTSEAFATVRGWLDVYAASGLRVDGVLPALSLLERRMGAQDAAIRGDHHGETCMVGRSALVKECTCWKCAALTDAPPVFTLEEVEAIEERLKGQIPNVGEGYADGWLDALDEFVKALTALRR